MNWLKERWAAFCQNLRTTLRIFSGRARYKVAEKETFVVTVGVVEGTSDKRRAVVFEGQQLAQRVHAEGLARITETLYCIGYEQYLIHTRTLHRTKGLRTELDLREVGEADLVRGRYAPLGRLRPLNLGEALL